MLDDIQLHSCVAGKFGEGKVWQIDSVRAFSERKFGELIEQPIDYYYNLDGFSLVNHRQFAKFVKLSHYTVHLAWEAFMYSPDAHALYRAPPSCSNGATDLQLSSEAFITNVVSTLPATSNHIEQLHTDKK